MGYPEDTAIEVKEVTHLAIGKTFFVLWRKSCDLPWGFYCKTAEEANQFRSGIPEHLRDDFDIVKVRVVG